VEPARRIVILVEDSDTSAEVLQLALCGLTSIELIRHRNAEDAMAHIEGDSEARCCALVTDLSLPRMDGFELIKRARKQRPADFFPILVISGDIRPETPARVLRLGANAYFHKPYSLLEVRRTLEMLLDDDLQPDNTH